MQMRRRSCPLPSKALSSRRPHSSALSIMPDRNGTNPEDADTFRFNLMTRKYCISFVNHPDDITLISSTCDMTTTPPTNTVLEHNFKAVYSPVSVLKNSIKRDASIFNTFKEGKYWDTWRRKTLATARAQDIAEVLNPDCHHVTADDVNLFKEK